MATSAAMIQYRKEQVAEFEEGMSWLRQTTVQEAMISGNQATFLVAGAQGETADTRGINGLIPAHPLNLTQNTATLTEWQYLKRVTEFNIFQSQGNLRRQLQMDTRKVLNRRIDQDIIDAMDGATTNLGAAQTASLSLVQKALVTLGENEVPVEEEDNMWAVVTDAFWGYLGQIPEWISADYVDIKPLTGPVKRVKRCWGVNWIRHHALTGKGTNSEQCFMFHRDAVGSAFDMDNLQVAAGYDEEQDYSWARARSFTGAVLLQQNGIVQMLHDASSI